jgi:hypothetical protein
VQRLMEDARGREQMISEFDAIMDKLGKGAASRQAAQVILEEIGANIERKHT